VEEQDKPKDELLYDDWDEFWGKGEKEPMTIAGRIMTPVRMKALRNTVKSLDIKTAIDLGCGFGRTLQLFEEAGLDYMGIDVSPNAVAVCKKKGLNAKLEKLEEHLKQYDLVLSEGMLEHFLNFEPYAKHFMRMSRRYVLLMQPNHKSFMGRTLYYVALLVRGHVNVFEYNYQPEDFIAVFRNNGFKVIKNDPVFFNTSRLLLFEKE